VIKMTSEDQSDAASCSCSVSQTSRHLAGATGACNVREGGPMLKPRSMLDVRWTGADEALCGLSQ
jgi:hypothetical protein